MTDNLINVCTPNISFAERRKRLISGAVMLAVGLAGWTLLFVSDLSPLWRLGLFPVFAGAATGYFQWREKT